MRSNDDRPMVHVRLRRSLLKHVDHLAVDWELDRARTVERLLDRAISDDGDSNEAYDGSREGQGSATERLTAQTASVP